MTNELLKFIEAVKKQPNAVYIIASPKMDACIINYITNKLINYFFYAHLSCVILIIYGRYFKVLAHPYLYHKRKCV